MTAGCSMNAMIRMAGHRAEPTTNREERLSKTTLSPISEPGECCQLTMLRGNVIKSAMRHITYLLRGEAMGAIAVSKEDEGQIGELMRELGVKSKAQVVRAALRTLRERLDRERLRSEIRESVKQCAEADQKENRLLAPGGVAGSS